MGNIKFKKILKEAAWDYTQGKALPTLDDVQKAYEDKIKLRDILENQTGMMASLHDDSGLVFSEKEMKKVARPELHIHLFSNINAAKNYSKVLGNMLKTIKGISRFSGVPTDVKVMKGSDFIKKYPKIVKKLQNSAPLRYEDKPWNDLYNKFDRTGTKLKHL